MPVNLDPINVKQDDNTKEEFDELIYIVTKSIYSLNLSKLALQIIENETFRPMHKSPFPSLALMNMLVIEERYDDIIKLFERNIQLFQLIETCNSQNGLRHHLTLVCEALLLKGDKTALK